VDVSRGKDPALGTHHIICKQELGLRIKILIKVLDKLHIVIKEGAINKVAAVASQLGKKVLGVFWMSHKMGVLEVFLLFTPALTTDHVAVAISP
jgi:hypothetical protein